jgi:UDP-N-acetylglucosamine/UDP-N-acetyl-alpha-D-glucosaminouronate 4-epimerase
MERMVVTGGAGFIGSNLAQHLAAKGHEVTIVDNFSTGRRGNLEGWPEAVAANRRMAEADVNETDRMRELFRGARFVFHQAAIPSVPRSIADPKVSHNANISGTLSVLIAARDAGVERVVVASSSSVYGDDPGLPKVETRLGRPLSPYALGKLVCEHYCRLFTELYGLQTACLRYFNVFGPRQDPGSQYSAVIPRFTTRLLSGKPPIIFGDGEQTRDFTFVENVIDANWKAATHPGAVGDVFNIGCGHQTSLNQLVRHLNEILGSRIEPTHEPGRPGDVRHSLADTSKALQKIDYMPAITIQDGLRRVVDWYRANPTNPPRS